MLSDQERDGLAEALLRAYDSRAPVAPLAELSAGFTAEDAYPVQLAQLLRWQAQGRRVRGHKVGLTSAAMQRMLGVDLPDYGHLLDDMFLPEEADVGFDRFLSPRVEPEIALVLGRSLAGPGVTVADAIAAVSFVVPAIEIIDSRIRDWKIGWGDTVADNASSAAVVLGSRPHLPTTVDLRLLGCNLFVNGALVATGAGGAALGSPVVALAWLANTLGRRGASLEEGEVVLPGSCTPAFPVAPGDVVSAEFAEIGVVGVRFGAAGGS